MTKSGLESALRPYDRLSDRIRLHRQADDRGIVVLEGPSDKRLLEAVVSPTDIVLFVAGTRDAAIDAARELHGMGFLRWVCLVDRDFDDVVATGMSEGLPLVAYDGADLEDALMSSPAIDRVLSELASQAKLEQFGIDELFRRTRDGASVVARLRRESKTQEWHLVFDEVDLASKIDRNSLEIAPVGLCQALKHATDHCEAPLKDLIEASQSGEQCLCLRTGRVALRGRDQLAFIGVALRKLIGDLNKDQTGPEFLDGVLRAAVDPSWIASSDWFQETEALLKN